MILVYVLLSLLLLWFVRQIWPVHSLHYIPPHTIHLSEESCGHMKLLDVRDASEFLKGHVPNAVNISVGRLPVVWNRELSPEDEVLIFSKNKLQLRKAARVLERLGFRQLYAVKGCYLKEARAEHIYEYNCCH